MSKCGRMWQPSHRSRNIRLGYSTYHIAHNISHHGFFPSLLILPSSRIFPGFRSLSGCDPFASKVILDNRIQTEGQQGGGRWFCEARALPPKSSGHKGFTEVFSFLVGTGGLLLDQSNVKLPILICLDLDPFGPICWWSAHVPCHESHTPCAKRWNGTEC